MIFLTTRLWGIILFWEFRHFLFFFGVSYEFVCRQALFVARPCWATWPLQPWALMCTAAADPCRRRRWRMRQEALGHCPKAQGLKKPWEAESLQYGHLPFFGLLDEKWTFNIGVLCWKWLWSVAIQLPFIPCS